MLFILCICNLFQDTPIHNLFKCLISINAGKMQCLQWYFSTYFVQFAIHCIISLVVKLFYIKKRHNDVTLTFHWRLDCNFSWRFWIKHTAVFKGSKSTLCFIYDQEYVAWLTHLTLLSLLWSCQHIVHHNGSVLSNIKVKIFAGYGAFSSLERFV